MSAVNPGAPHAGQVRIVTAFLWDGKPASRRIIPSPPQPIPGDREQEGAQRTGRDS